jgi:hypothetical protein
VTGTDRESIEIEALRTDRYLEALLTGAGPTDQRPAPDPSLRVAAMRLQRGLQRVHPSFRFEERLAGRLADLADAMSMPVAAGAEERATMVLPFPFHADQDPAGPDPGDEPVGRLPRPVLIGGAVASAAISIAGAAFVAWRLGRPGDPLSRAARVAHQLRVVGPGPIGPGGVG